MIKPKLAASSEKRLGCKSGAGRYFTARPLIRAIVDVMQPEPRLTIIDPAAGTGGFLVAAHEYITHHYVREMDADDKRFLSLQALRGTEIVDSAARLCAMNLFFTELGAMRVPFALRTRLRLKTPATTTWC